MHTILTLLRKDFAILRRNRSALVLTLAVPMIIIYIVGLVFGLGRKESGPSGILLGVANQSDHPAARQLVSHGHIRVNGARVDRPSYAVDIGDAITLSPRAQERPSIQEMIARGPVVKLPSYLALDTEQEVVGRMIQMPMRQDIPFIVDDAAIVEFYAQ